MKSPVVQQQEPNSRDVALDISGAYAYVTIRVQTMLSVIDMAKLETVNTIVVVNTH